MNTQNLRSALLLLSAGSVALLAGCGGGGGNGNTSTSGTTGTTGTGTTGTGTTGTSTGSTGTSQIVGKVTDANGNGLPGVSISVDTGGEITSTINTGGYRLSSLSVAVHKISANASVNGVAYSGSTQVLTSTNPATGLGNLNSNVNILLSPTSLQTTVEGFVRDGSGNPLVGASVYAAVPSPAIAAAGSAGTYSSLVAFTDSTGFYQISNIPSNLPSGSLLVTASASGTANQNATLGQSGITSGGIATQNFTLNTATAAAADTPVLTGINAFTQPTDDLTGSALQAHLVSGSGSVYEGLRRRLSPLYAANAARKRTVSKHLAARATAGAYAVELDIAFNPPASTDVNLAGYNVYRTTGPLATNMPIESTSGASADGYDTLFDPLANYYTDLTASTDPANISPPVFGPYLGGTEYNFALSSVSTTGSQSPLSATYSITPLSPITLTAPVAGTTVLSPVTLTWSPVTGASRYLVFIYSQYPSISSTPLTSQTVLTGTTSASFVLPGGSLTYYALVVAGEDETETAATGASATTNAAQSYSEIVPFTVQ